ncbi:MAG: hypothetical protein IT379_16805 [Deltaproteobacteria bacterium]|nr:hypothetical protein [Deltaproteobacteria bacterium]
MSKSWFMVVACPRCGSRRCTHQGTRHDGRKRYYRCRVCDNTWTAWRLEVESPSESEKDRPDVRTPPR